MKTQIEVKELKKLKDELEIVLSFPIPGDAKLYLNDLYENVLISINDVISKKEALIQSLGKEVNGEYQIEPTIKNDKDEDITNPGYFLYLQKQDEIDSSPVVFTHTRFMPEILKEVRSEFKFPILYRFFFHGFFI